MKWLALACSVVIACAKSAQMAGAPAPRQATEDPHAEIDRRSQLIDQKRGEMGLPAPAGETPPVAPNLERMALPRRSAQDTSCHPATNDTCKQSCTLADDICDNADHICDLAKQLPGDGWAERKCRDADSTCSAAHGKCCSCT